MARRLRQAEDLRAVLKIVGVLVLRGFALVLAIVAAFIFVTALVGRNVQWNPARWLIGGLVVLALPLAIQGQAVQWLRRFAKIRVPGSVTFLTAFNALLVLALALMGRQAGESLRRHGDWFLGYDSTPEAERWRNVIRFVAARLERFRLPPEMQPVTLLPDRNAPFYGPLLPGQTPPRPTPTHIAWLHPLAGARVLPLWESRRFGAARSHASPAECERGHCGVDLAADMGQPVYAAFDGVVERAERDAQAGGLAGRYIRVGHLGGTVVTRYIHLDTIRRDLREGDHVVAGELIARAGRTGVKESDTHLHFALSLRPGGRDDREVYVDPEPYLLLWDIQKPPLPAPSAPTEVAHRRARW